VKVDRGGRPLAGGHYADPGWFTSKRTGAQGSQRRAPSRPPTPWRRAPGTSTSVSRLELAAEGGRWRPWQAARVLRREERAARAGGPNVTGEARSRWRRRRAGRGHQRADAGAGPAPPPTRRVGRDGRRPAPACPPPRAWPAAPD